MNIIDLRSDTVTKPTQAMWEAMSSAEVGDDVYGEDPTVNRLQDMAAAMLGKEAGLFVPTGTMGNLASILAQCGRGDEIILGDLSHTYLFEAGGVSALGGIHPRALRNQPDGSLDLEEVLAAIRTDDAHFPVTRLIALETTHNRCRGAVLPLDYLDSVAGLARVRGLKLHLDGARLFNAAVAQGVSPAVLAAPFDSVTFCLSKALCAPAGSLIVGDRAFIHRAHRARKMLGGGMRQAGVLAAAGIVALQTMVERLADDHLHARSLAQRLAAMPGLTVENPEPATNMVYVAIDAHLAYSDEEFQAALAGRGVRIGRVAPRRYRLVTHYWIGSVEVDLAVEAFQDVLVSASLS